MSSRIMDEIVESLRDFTPSSDGGARAVFSFEEGFIGFQGHFPQQKVLPGVCLVQCALATLHRASGAEHELTGVINAKFTSVVVPGDVIDCTCSPLVEKKGLVVLNATIRNAKEVVAKLTLSVSSRANPVRGGSQ